MMEVVAENITNDEGDSSGSMELLRERCSRLEDYALMPSPLMRRKSAKTKGP